MADLDLADMDWHTSVERGTRMVVALVGDAVVTIRLGPPQVVLGVTASPVESIFVCLGALEVEVVDPDHA